MPERQKMVGWYDPGQLLQTAGEVVISTIFGRHSDHRIIEALFAGTEMVYDFTVQFQKDSKGEYVDDGKGWYARDGERQEIWIDYVADTGDGWDSTYAIACCAAQPTLNVTDPNGQAHPTARGSILIFGGDEVYPTPDRKEYQQRLVQPYEAALRSSDPLHPFVFAIPGNHDWYDSLVSFTRLFIAKKWFAGWIAPQGRSYFALKLPHEWWLIGTDVQLGSDIDELQLKYFREAAKQMGQRDRVILCTAEPHWIYSKLYEDYDSDVYCESNLEFLERKIFGRKVSVFIAGDLHHYRRHAAADHTQKITAGGGGAFLHPTHGADVSTLQGGFTLKSSFPDVATSKCLCWRNLVFPLLNPKFGFLTAILYVLTSWAVMADIAHIGISQIGRAVEVTIRTALGSPASALWGVILFLGIWLFTDTHSKWYRWIAGSIHGVAHVIATFFLGWGAAYLCVEVLGFGFQGIRQLVLSGILIGAGGYVVGSLIMGIYLLVSLNFFGHHSNEAFSSLAIPDWKNFLRLKIGGDGKLTIFPIGIRRVPRKWKPSGSKGAGPEFAPDDPKASGPELIEPPIVVN